MWREEREWSRRRAPWEWLRKSGSLTAHLRQLGDVQVDVLYEHLIVVGPHASTIGRQRSTAMWTRDVTLRVEGRPAIVARTLVEAADSDAAWRAIKGLQDKPLATILYDDAAVRRSPFEYCLLGPEHRLYRLARRVEPITGHQRLWARRSVFERRGARLAVAECFLPWLYRP
ncbi:chorismate--pyruvate lyase family protein [Cupriavidus numazuensis]|uniref:chorismate--pyruvate lyase family protein n=1 Tax=Cupriavidus numazuensis TaxID=221992 RepID=UPI00387E5A7B